MRKVWAVLAGSVVAVGVAVGTPGTASASVSITPTQAPQGGAVELAFRLVEDRPGVHTTKVEVQLPAATPIAEVYPLSDPDWATKITYRELGRPIPAGHASGTTTVATAGITWFRVAGGRGEGSAASLRVAMAPLPQVQSLAFTVLQTYSDGKVRRWPSVPGGQGQGAPVLVLTSNLPASAGSHAAGHVAGGVGSDAGGSAEIVVLGLFLVLLAGLVLTARRFRRARPPAPDEDPLEPPDEEAPRPADREPTRTST